MINSRKIEKIDAKVNFLIMTKSDKKRNLKIAKNKLLKGKDY